MLAAIGLYGVMAYGVAKRTSEIGVRMAIGARSSEILRLVIGGGLRLAAMGVVAGLAAGFAVTRLVSSFLFGVSPFDPVIYASVIPLLLAVTSLACYFPARRATRLDPIIAVRYE